MTRPHGPRNPSSRRSPSPWIAGAAAVLALAAFSACKKKRPADEEATGGVAGGESSDEAPAKTKVPDLMGKTVEDAQAEAAKAGLTANASGPPEDKPGAAPGTVVKQKPGAGEEVSADTTIEIALQKAAPPPAKRTKVPGIIGLSEADARKKLRDAELDLRITQKKINGKKPGTVVTQAPGANDDVNVHAAVDVTIESDWVAVPPLKNTTVVDAILKLRKLGLDWNGTTETSSGLAPGVVSGQAPEASSKVEEGKEVKLIVARAAPGKPAKTPSWYQDVDDLKNLSRKDNQELTALLGKVLPETFVSGIQFDPPSHKTLWSGDPVEVSFSYAAELGKNAMVVICPIADKVMVGSSITFTAHPGDANNYKGTFTVQTNKTVVVTALRITMYDKRKMLTQLWGANNPVQCGRAYRKVFDTMYGVDFRFSPP